MKRFMRENVMDLTNTNEELMTKFKADRIYLGTYKYQTTEDVVITSKGLRLFAPHCKHPNEKTILNIQKSEILKIVGNFDQKCILVLYVLNTCGKYIRECLEMSADGEGGYFSPMSLKPGERRIIIEAEISEKEKTVIKALFPSNIMEEVSASDIAIFGNL